MRNRIFVQKKLAKASKVNASSSKILKANFSISNTEHRYLIIFSSMIITS